jgi:hypothetical protein
MFSFIFDAIDSVIGQIFSLANQVQDDVFGVINGYVDQVNNGIWKGTGADAFVLEMQDVVLPQVANLIAALAGAGGGGGGGFIDWIKGAVGIMGDLDNAIGGVAGAIGDVFDSIF